MAKRTRNIKTPNRGNLITKSRFPKMFPTLYCPTEKLYVAVCSVPLRSNLITVKGPHGKPVKTISYKKKITHEHFKEWCCSWRDESYKIDFTHFKVGDIVRCPVCKCEIDFRAFPSDTTPQIVKMGDNS